MSEIEEFFKEYECLIVEFQYHDEAFIFCDICKKKIKGEITLNLFKKDENGNIELSQTLCRECGENIDCDSIMTLDYNLAGHDICKIIRDKETFIPSDLINRESEK
jgi:hypothetical protein